jgi:predicted ATPase
VPERHRPLLEVAAVVGRKIDLPLLRAVDPSADVDAWLTACVAAGVLDADDSGTSEGRWRFAHDKLREGLLRDLSPTRRRDLHHTVGETIEAHVPEPGTLAIRLAHHWREAGDPARELRYVALAGEQAIRSGANPEAVRYFQRGLELLAGMPDFPEKQSYELDFNLALGAAIMARFGYAAPEVAAVYERALDLCRQLGSTNRMFQALSNLAGYYMARAEYRTAHNLGEEMQQIALRTGATTRVLWSHLILGQSLAFMGDYTSAAFHLQQMVDQYDPERRRGSTRFSAIQDFGVSAQAFLGVTVWALGEPDRALALGLESLRTARAIDHPFSEAFALHWTGIIHYLRGEYDVCLRMAEETLALAQQKNFALFLWLGRVWEGRARVQLGDASDTVLDLIRDGMSAYRASGAEFGVPFFLAGLAETLLQAGRIDEAAAALDDAWALMAKTGERWLEPELIRLRGDVAAAQGDAPVAEGHYRDGLSLASARKGNGFALRSALALARLLADERPDEALAVLRPVYAAFGEGFETQDLRAARTVLEALR